MAKLTAKAKLIENVKLVCENNRGHSVICDLSEASGGTNAGPTPLEGGLMALGGCDVIIFADVCKNSKIDPGKVEIIVEAQKSGDSPVIKRRKHESQRGIKNQKALLEGAWRRTDANCPVVFIFKENLPVKVEFELKEK